MTPASKNNIGCGGLYFAAHARSRKKRITRLLLRGFRVLARSRVPRSLFSFLVVVWVVRVEPIALAIDVEVGDLREFRRLNQKLLLGDEARNEFDFVFIQVKLAAIQVAVHVGVREENLGGAAFDDDVEDVGALRSSSDWVDKTIAALCFRQVLSASTTYRCIAGFFKNTQASSMKKALKTELISRSAMTEFARCRM